MPVGTPGGGREARPPRPPPRWTSASKHKTSFAHRSVSFSSGLARVLGRQGVAALIRISFDCYLAPMNVSLSSTPSVRHSTRITPGRLCSANSSRRRPHRGILTATLVVSGVACQPPIDDDPFADEGGESEVGDGVFLVEVDLPAGETDGEEPALIPTGHCLTVAQDPLFGYTHQCEGELGVSWVGVGVVVGKEYPFSGHTGFGFGPGQANPDWWIEPDDYDNPLVAACCGIFDYDNPTTEEKLPYVNNCIFDSVQQLCLGLPRFIDRLAEQIPEAEENRSAKQKALGDISDYIDGHTSDCIWAFWEPPPGPLGSGVNELGGTEYSFCWTNNDCVTFALDNSTIYDWTTAHDIPEPVPMWDVCHSWDDNNTSVVPTANIEVPGYSFSETGLALPGALVLLSSPFGFETLVLDEAASRVASRLDAAGSIVVSQLTLSAVETDGVRTPMVTLDTPMRPQLGPLGWVVPAGEASFTATVAFDGGSRIVAMSNTGDMVFRQTSIGWEFELFQLNYVDRSGHQWLLDVSDLKFDLD